MKIGRRTGVLTWTLAALCAGLLATIGLELASGIDNAPATGVSVTASTQAMPAPSQVAINFPPLPEFAEVIERPLFDASRRPPPKPEPEQATPVQFDQLELEGIVKSADSNLAIIYDKRQRQTLRLQQGAKLGPWVLAEIRDDGIIFEKGTATHEMLLHPETPTQQHPGAGTAAAQRARKR